MPNFLCVYVKSSVFQKKDLEGKQTLLVCKGLWLLEYIHLGSQRGSIDVFVLDRNLPSDSSSMVPSH